MKVLFQTRTNLYSAPGGDLIQIENTKKYLEKQGITVDISLELQPNLDDYDLVHLFNLMDPQDIYLQMKNATRQNKKIVLSTIYGLYTEFDRKGRKGLIPFIFKFLSPYQIQYIKIVMRHFAEKRMHQGVIKMMLMGNYRLMKSIADNTSVFMPNSVSEMNRVAKEFKLKTYQFVNVPNAIDKEIFTGDVVSDKYKDLTGCILCAARIEGRKSTLNLVKAVKNLPYKLVLAGKESANQKAFVDMVHQEAGDNVTFLGPVSHQDLRELYSVAKVHALISWMETPGLSSLEAAAMGSNIVVTPRGDTYEYFGDLAYYCEPDDVQSIKDALVKAYENPVNPALKEKVLENYNWEKTAEMTIQGYKMALAATK